MASLAQLQFSSSLHLETQLKKCSEQTKAVVSTLTSSVHKGTEWSAEHQRVVTDAFAVLASLPAHSELTKTERVQKQAFELCKCLVISIKSLSDKKKLFEVYDERVGGMLAQVLVQELYRPYSTCFPLSDMLWIFGELCLASPRTRAWAVERSASHQLASLCEQENECPGVQKQAQIALCKLLYIGIDEHFVFQSRFVDLFMDKTIQAPKDVKSTAWTLGVLCKMQEKSERALEYIWRQSPVSRVIVDVLSSNPCPENSSKIICLLRFPATTPELRMLLARSGVWEVLHAIVSQTDVNGMTLQRFAEVFEHFAVCPVTGPLLVGFEAHHTLITALQRVKNTDFTTADKLLLCAYKCCKQNKAFGAKIAGTGLLGKMHDMSVRASLFTLSIFLARYTATWDGQDMGHILAREVRLLTDILRFDKAPRSAFSAEHKDDFTQEWVRFVRDVRDSDICALAPELVKEFAESLLTSSNTARGGAVPVICKHTANACRGPALHLLARMVACRSDVHVRACDVRTLAEQELPYTRAVVCTGLLALAGSLYDAQCPHAVATPKAKDSGGSGGSGGPCAKRQNSRAEADAEDVVTVQEVSVTDTSSAVVTTITDNDTDSEDSTDDMHADNDTREIGLTGDDLECMQRALPNNVHLLGMLLWLWPVFSPARLDWLCDMFLAAFKGKRSQCLLAMDVIDALLLWDHKECALKLACNCGLDQLWNTVEKRMSHCEQQASVKFMSTFARVCLLARQENERDVLDTQLTLPFYAVLLAHLQRTVAVHELELAHALVGLLHTVLDVQPDAGAVLLLGGAALKLVRVSDALAGDQGTSACLHKEIGRLVQRIVPEQHAALLASFEQPREERSPRKRKLEECVKAESV